jgi:alpha-galactosidase
VDAMTIVKTLEADMRRSREFTERYFSSANRIPISFSYGGKPVDGIPGEWASCKTWRRIDANLNETIFEGTDPATGLQVSVELLEYQDYPVVEFVAWLANTGREKTPVISGLHAFNGEICSTPGGGAPVLCSSNGDTHGCDGYSYDRTRIDIGETLCFAPAGGRPSDSAFPYFRLVFAGGGCSFAIGWPGQWAAVLTGMQNGALVKAGQERTHFSLLPGERIRTPRMSMLFWDGDESHGIDLWRRWYMDHILPKPDGRPIRPMLINGCIPKNWDTEGNAAGYEKEHLHSIRRHKEEGFDLDIWFMDAGWYIMTGDKDFLTKEDLKLACFDEPEHIIKFIRWLKTGTWITDPLRFPDGMRPISDEAAKNGMKYLLWFEPERVFQGTWIDQNHPEWLLSADDLRSAKSGSRLLNLGDPACLQWITNLICKFIEDWKIKIYRQDFNMALLPYWIANEADDRQGVLENFYMQGYLKFWDGLLQRNPGLIIDSCSSGGRRNDLETMRRSIPFTISDYCFGRGPIKRSFQYTLHQWIPFFAHLAVAYKQEADGSYANEGSFATEAGNYAFHTGMSPTLSLYMDIDAPGYDHAYALKMVKIWRQAAEYMLSGDFRPLTPYSKDIEGWSAWQFDVPGEDKGYIQAVRHQLSPDGSLTVFPVVKENARYLLTNPETGETAVMHAEQLIRDGFTFNLPAFAGALWFYRVDHSG